MTKVNREAKFYQIFTLTYLKKEEDWKNQKDFIKFWKISKQSMELIGIDSKKVQVN